MAPDVLLAGGSGVVGQQAAKAFRARHPAVPILIGGRDIAKAEVIARRIGNATAVRVDTSLPRLGLDRDLSVSVVAMMVPDAGLHGMRLAQDLGVPYLSIGNLLSDVGAAFRPMSAENTCGLPETRSTERSPPLDGRTLAGAAFAPYDIVGLAAAADDIRMDLAWEPRRADVEATASESRWFWTSEARSTVGPSPAVQPVNSPGGKQG